MKPSPYRHVLCVVVFVGISSSVDASITPILSVTALGGQYFSSSAQSTGSDFDVNFAPTVGVSPSLSLTPIYLASYRETQSPYNFQGQNVLIQKQVDQMGVLYLTWAVNSIWRVKPRVGYKQEWAEQNTGESLSTGLFNYHRVFTGIAMDADFPKGNWEVSYEWGRNIYPNFQALTGDPRLANLGITAESGVDVLNFAAHDSSLSCEFWSASRRWHFTNNFSWIREDFSDQTVVLDLGEFEDKNRTDDVFILSLNQDWTTSRKHWTYGLGETIQYYVSNQNAFDANQIFFTNRYYNFVDVQLNPTLTLTILHDRLDVLWQAGWGYRRYSHRRTQDASGNYLDDLIHSRNQSAGVTMRYRIVKSLYAVLVRNIVTYSSNTNYEANYPYNYTVFDILGGLSWQY